MLKNKTKIISPLLTLLIIGFLAYRQVPIWISNYQTKHQLIQDQDVQDLRTGENFIFPNNTRSLVIFWASWCAPCKIEMARIQNSIDHKKIDPTQVYAYNPYESLSQIQRFLRQNDYSFTFFSSERNLFREIPIKATPSFLWLDHMKVEKLSTGINLIGIFRIEAFLKG